MSTAASIVVVVVAALHLGFLVLESFLWATPTGRRIFGTTPAQAEETRVLALNQGLYNGFLAAGLIFGLCRGERSTVVFFLACVAVAGLVGGFTAKKSILVLQMIPALVGLALVLL